MFVSVRGVASSRFGTFYQSNGGGCFAEVQGVPLRSLLFAVVGEGKLALTLRLEGCVGLTRPNISVSGPKCLGRHVGLGPSTFLRLCGCRGHGFCTSSAFSACGSRLVLTTSNSSVGVPAATRALGLCNSTDQGGAGPRTRVKLNYVCSMVGHVVLRDSYGGIGFGRVHLTRGRVRQVPRAVNDVPCIVVVSENCPSAPTFVRVVSGSVGFVMHLGDDSCGGRRGDLARGSRLIGVGLSGSEVERCRKAPSKRHVGRLNRVSLHVMGVLLRGKDLRILTAGLSRARFRARRVGRLCRVE